MARKYIPEKVKRILQKEINSKCPFCDNIDVDHFQIHHIDEDSSNDFMGNLLMLCANCHSKITKGDISQMQVLKAKALLPQKKGGVEFVSVVPDSKHSKWERSDYNFTIFNSINGSEMKEHLVLNWSFINNTTSTIILKGLSYSAITLPAGLTGPAIPSILKPIATYNVPILFNQGIKREHLSPQIQIPEGHGFQIQTVHYSAYEKDIYALAGRFYIDFTFEFSSNIKIEIPRLFFNCSSEKEELPHYGWS
jgi:hypothetical protein